MKKIISFNQAVVASLAIWSLLVLFHFSILIGMLFFDFAPIDFLWGGQMETLEQLLKFEFVSLIISFIFLILVAIKSKRINWPKLLDVAHFSMWILCGIMALNTVGNLVAKSNFEKYFAIVTGLLAFLSLRLALEEREEK